MYPRNAASPEPIAIGPVVQISDGAVQTTGVTVRIKPIGVAEGDGAGTTAYSTDGVILYTPTQAETNYTSFVLIAKKTGCIPSAITVVTTASATPGTVLLAPVTHTSAVVPTVTTLTNLPAITTDWLTAAGIAADAGVEIAAAVWDRVLSAATHNIANSAGRRLRTLQDTGNYLGFVWIDTNGANTGSTFPEDGTFLNPVNTLANAITVAAAATQPIKEFAILSGSTITLASTFSGYDFVGENWTLALGGQDISGSRFNRAATGVSGTATGTNPFFYECSIGNVTVPPASFQMCGLSGTLTVGSAGAYYLVDCFSQVAGTGAPVIDMGAAVGATSVNIRRWSGGLTINNIASGDVISIDVISGGTITLSGADGNVQVRGMCNVVDNRTGSPTLGTTNNMDARFDAVETQLTTIDTVADGIATEVGKIPRGTAAVAAGPFTMGVTNGAAITGGQSVTAEYS